MKSCLINLNVLTFENMNKYQILLFMFRLHNKQYPRPDSFYLEMNSQIRNHYTKSALHYRGLVAHVKIKQFSVLCVRPVLRIILSDSIKNSQSLGIFKKSLKNT